MAEILNFVQNKQNGGRRHLELLFVTVDHPQSLLHGPNIVLKFHVNRFTTVGDMAIWTFGKFGLKRLFPNWDLAIFPSKFPKWRLLPSELVSNKIQNGGSRHIENHIFGHNSAIIARLCTEFET